jgi:O-antigen/teichoic acid export membrane protein
VVVVKNTLWLSLCRFIADFSGLVLFTCISRYLGPIATGEYSYAFALGAFISIIAAYGLDQYGVRQYSQLHTEAERNACWRGMLLVQCLQLLCGLALLGLAILFLGGREADPLIIVELAVFLSGWGLSRLLFVPATAREAMAAPAVIELTCRSAASLAALALCLAGVRSLPLVLVGFPIAGIVLAAIAGLNAARHGAQFSLSTHWAEIRSIIRNTVPFTTCEALAQFYIRADLLLLVLLLGTASAGWYAADLKIVEVGVTPLLLFGTAAYPRLSRAALLDPDGFVRISEEFLRGVLFVSGWLAIGMYCLIPMVIPALFGSRFQPAVGLLPIFSVLALTKGLELGLARLLYATKRQNTYMRALAVGTVVIIVLNIWLIPHYGMTGAIIAVVVSNVLVDVMAIKALRSDLGMSVFAMALGRVSLPLAGTLIVFTALDATVLNDWLVAVIGCAAFPAISLLSGLMPHPRRSLLFT